MKHRRNNKCPTGLIFVFLGLGIMLVCIFPAQWMLVVLAVMLVAAGVMLMKC